MLKNKVWYETKTVVFNYQVIFQITPYLCREVIPIRQSRASSTVSITRDSSTWILQCQTTYIL